MRDDEVKKDANRSTAAPSAGPRETDQKREPANQPEANRRDQNHGDQHGVHPPRKSG